jgi:hypothetical protein
MNPPRRWPAALADQPVTLTRLLDPDRVLRARIAEFVNKGEFGFASGAEPAGGYRRVWFHEDIDPVEITFDADLYLLTKAVAARLKTPEVAPPSRPEPGPPESPVSPEEPSRPAESPTSNRPALISVTGNIPAEQWNRLGTRLIPKMRAAGTLTAAIRLETEVDPARIAALLTELQQIIDEIGLSATVRVQHG